MHPALSVITFTTLLGAAQGLLVALGTLRLLGVAVPHLLTMVCIATVLLVASLGASFFHLGHPERAWRAAAMWRTSWLSREVIVLPMFIGLAGLWALLEALGRDPFWVILALMLVALVLWGCTAMIYACLRFIQEWAHPITVVNYFTLGIASGLVLLVFLLAVLAPQTALLPPAIIAAIAATALALVTRSISLWRNARLRPASTIQTATGIQHAKVRQTSMGMSAGAFNTREFFHGKSMRFVRHAKTIMLALCFAIPLALLIAALALNAWAMALAAFPLHYAGLLAERWLFFAQARHPQNLYYQTVS